MIQTKSRSLLLLLAVACGGIEQSTETTDGIMVEQSTPNTQIQTPNSNLICQSTGDCCASDKVHFYGKCRKSSYFERFLSDGAELGGIAGPSRLDTDTGVIVVETMGLNVLRFLYIEPDRATETRRSGTLYRANFPVVSIETQDRWQDSAGYFNELTVVESTIIENFRPTFGVSYWSQKTYTPSGYTILDSDGNSQISIASSSSGAGYCDSVGGAVDLSATAACGGTGLGGSLVAGAVSGIASGAVTFVVITGSTFGLGAEIGVGAGVGVGVGVGGSVTAAGVAGTAVLCSKVGDFAEDAAEGICDALTTPDSEIPPGSLPRYVPWLDYSENGECPVGMIRYSGEAEQCSTTFTSESSGTDSEIVVTGSDEVVCETIFVSNACVIP